MCGYCHFLFSVDTLRLAFCDLGSSDLFDLLDFENRSFCGFKMRMRSFQSFFILTERNGKRVRRFVSSTVFLRGKHIHVARVLHIEDVEEHWVLQVLESGESIVKLLSVLPLKRWQKSKRRRRLNFRQ